MSETWKVCERLGSVFGRGGTAASADRMGTMSPTEPERCGLDVAGGGGGGGGDAGGAAASTPTVNTVAHSRRGQRIGCPRSVGLTW